MGSQSLVPSQMTHEGRNWPFADWGSRAWDGLESMQITSNHQTISMDYFASICTTSRLPVDILCQRGGFWNYSLGYYLLLRYRVTSSPNSAHFSWFLEAWIFNATMLFTKRMLTVGYPDGTAYHFQQFNKRWWKHLCHTEPLLRWKSWCFGVLSISVRPCMLSHSMFPISMPPCSEGGAVYIIYVHR